MMDASLDEDLDELTHRSIGWLALLGIAAMFGFAWTDRFLVPEGSRIHWLAARCGAALFFAALFVITRRTSPSRWSFLYAYAGIAVCVTVIVGMNIFLGKFPSDHYAAIILIVAAPCLVTWSARHTFLTGLCAVGLWLGVNFHDAEHFDIEAFSFHAGYLVIGLLISTSVSHVRQLLTVQTLKQRRDLRLAVEAREALARQTSHDIRSPVAAMSMVCDHGQELGEDLRLLLRDAVARVNDIANNLVTWHGGASVVSGDDLAEFQISPLLHSLVSEKRATLRASGVKFRLTETSAAAARFAKVNAGGFRRAISNLLNNAAESMPSGGVVCIDLQESGDWLTLTIQDHGCGIAPENLAKVQQGGVSIGKQGGQGLGLSSAAAVVREWGGSLDVASRCGEGTTITVRLPRGAPARWFAPQINIAAGTTVLVLDDDPSMGHLWESRFREHTGAGEVTLKVFALVDEFINAARHCATPLLCLTDVELLGSRLSGIEATDKTERWSDTVFITSRYDDPVLQEKCCLLGAQIAPKAYAGHIPIVVTP